MTFLNVFGWIMVWLVVGIIISVFVGLVIATGFEVKEKLSYWWRFR